MPRKPDATLEGRILKAAWKLWIRGGSEALSMRAVARAARSNTPAIYRRFRNRKEILRALVRRSQQDLFQVLETCESMEQAGLRYYEFALDHPREYQLLAGTIGKLNEPQPGFALLRRRSAEWFGGSPEDYTRLLLAVWSVAHGTAELLINKTAPKDVEADLRLVVPAALEVLVRNRAVFAPKA